MPSARVPAANAGDLPRQNSYWQHSKVQRCINMVKLRQSWLASLLILAAIVACGGIGHSGHIAAAESATQALLRWKQAMAPEATEAMAAPAGYRSRRWSRPEQTSCPPPKSLSCPIRVAWRSWTPPGSRPTPTSGSTCSLSMPCETWGPNGHYAVPRNRIRSGA